MIEGLCIWMVMWLVGWAVARFVALAPLFEPTLLFQPNSRFRISDLVVLLLHVQLAAGGSAIFFRLRALGYRANDGSDIVVGMLFLSMPVLISWVTGIRAMANAGVEETKSRWLFAGVLVPFTMLAGAVVTPLLITSPWAALMGIQAIVEGDGYAFSGLVVYAGAIATTIAWLAYVRSATKHMARAAIDAQSRREGIEYTRSRLDDAGSITPLTSSERKDEDGVHFEDRNDAGISFVQNDGGGRDAPTLEPEEADDHGADDPDIQGAGETPRDDRPSTGD
ncbi:MAG: hypothetical protein QGG36_06500 [Pirellulaceae bacterium]|nr:hypothetical protein [Pirellulaceae bacterium]